MNEKRVMEGSWLYEGVSPVRILIEEVDRIPGSGDYEDKPEDRFDRLGRFYLLRSSPVGVEHCSNLRGWFSSVDEAVMDAEAAFKGIEWK